MSESDKNNFAEEKEQKEVCRRPSVHFYIVRQDQINKAKVRSNLEAAGFSCSNHYYVVRQDQINKAW